MTIPTWVFLFEGWYVDSGIIIRRVKVIKIINPFVKGLFIGIFLTLSFTIFVAAISNNSKVVPICLVKPGIVGFVPLNGSSIGNVWYK